MKTQGGYKKAVFQMENSRSTYLFIVHAVITNQQTSHEKEQDRVRTF